jgi:hypothetical protein
MRVTLKRSLMSISLSLFTISNISSFTALTAVLAGVGILSILQGASAITITGGGYTATDINYSGALPTNGWTTLGQNPFSPNANDGATNNITLGLNFNFYGQNYTSVLIGSNGILSFGANGTGITSGANVDLTTPNPPVSPNLPAIAVLWDDWSAQGQGNVRYQTITTNSVKQFIVQWEGVRHGTLQANDFVTFQAILYEGTTDSPSKILLSYSDLFLNNTSTSLNDGRNATVGIRGIDGNTDASKRLQWSYNASFSSYAVTTGKAICFNAGTSNAATCP